MGKLPVRSLVNVSNLAILAAAFSGSRLRMNGLRMAVEETNGEIDQRGEDNELLHGALLCGSTTSAGAVSYDCQCSVCQPQINRLNRHHASENESKSSE